MCLRVDDGAGVGETCPTPPPSTDIDAQDSLLIVDRALLREKNAQLHEMQARLLSVPRGAERKSLQKSAAILDQQIKCLKQNFVHNSEVEKAAVALGESISNGEPNGIASALQRVINMPVALDAMDDIALCYLISASEGVVTAMQRHPHHAGVMEGGCHALCNLFGGLNQLANGESIALQLSRAEVGDVIICGMAELVDERGVQFYGCRMLSILAVNMKQRDTAASSQARLVDEYEAGCEPMEDAIAHACFFTGARVAVARARRRHAEDVDILQWADCAMRLL